MTEPSAEIPEVRPDGPWDASDERVPDLQRVDLGGIRVPLVSGAELSVNVQDGQVVEVVLVHGASHMQLSAFAAPRREGIWDEVRGEIATSLKEQGGEASEQPGPFGTELRARIAGEHAGTTVPARFFGTDGPRWFLRALVTGPAATDLVQAGPFHDVYRDTIVARGGEAMAPRDPLALHLPREVLDAAGQPPVIEPTEAESQYADLDPFHRGPEITEIH